MTPEEKADYLIHSFSTWEGTHDFEYAVIHSNFCVDQIIEQWVVVDTYIGDGQGLINPNLKYWQEVKKELEKYDTDII
jgi:hypothetical protein